jgi:hypothetical protein
MRWNGREFAGRSEPVVLFGMHLAGDFLPVRFLLLRRDLSFFQTAPFERAKWAASSGNQRVQTKVKWTVFAELTLAKWAVIP